MRIAGDNKTLLECCNKFGYLADNRNIGLIGMDILQDLTLVMERGRFWLLSPDEWEVTINHVGNRSCESNAELCQCETC